MKGAEHFACRVFFRVCRTKNTVKNNQNLNDELYEDFYPQISLLVKENKGAWQSNGVVIALGAATFSFAAAVACNLIALLASSDSEIHFFKQISLVLFALFLPLMMLGAHFLDLLEEKYFYL